MSEGETETYNFIVWSSMDLQQRRRCRRWTLQRLIRRTAERMWHKYSAKYGARGMIREDSFWATGYNGDEVLFETDCARAGRKSSLQLRRTAIAWKSPAWPTTFVRWGTGRESQGNGSRVHPGASGTPLSATFATASSTVADNGFRHQGFVGEGRY